MALVNFRKESSERSDRANWAKALLMQQSGYFFESIEGCNQNAANLVTHLIERARVDYKAVGKSTREQVLHAIHALEGLASLQRKINFAACFGLPLTYVLYCDEIRYVYMLQFNSLQEIEPVRTFKSYEAFAEWIAEVKGWRSHKEYREEKDLPAFDKALREAGTAWPTNIDCFVCDSSNQPIAILEFQNAKNTRVARHCNNDFFLCKMANKNSKGETYYNDDIRRWTSQEILRVQSGLRLLVITWAQHEDDFQLKEIEKVSIPCFKSSNGHRDWKRRTAYKEDLHRYANSGKCEEQQHAIAESYPTYTLRYEAPCMREQRHHPPLSHAQQTFPAIYYRSKELVKNDRSVLVHKFTDLLQS